MIPKLLSLLVIGIVSVGLQAETRPQKAYETVKDPYAKRKITGCLTKPQGSYIFMTETGEELDAIGSDDLQKHINQKVKITGTTSDEDGKKWFHVSKIELAAASCVR